MAIPMLVVALIIGIVIMDFAAYFPLDLLAWLNPPQWLTLTAVVLLFSWCFGD